MKYPWIKESSFFDTLLFWISIAFVAGVAGFIGGGMRINAKASLEPLVQPQTVILADRTRGTDKQTTSLDDILSSIGKSMVSLYRGQSPRGQESQFLGFGLAVTSDGWLVTTVQLERSPTSYSVFTDQNQFFPVTQIVQDTAAGYTFLKIQNTNLRPIEFSSFTDPFHFEEGYLIRNRSSIERMIVTPPRIPDSTTDPGVIQKTSRLNKVLNPSSSFTGACMPVIRDERFVYGCTTESGVRSFRYLHRSLSALLKKGVHERPTLDIPYRNLAMAPFSASAPYRTGALIVLDTKKTIRLAVAGGSTLQLRNGDVVISVNGEAIDQNRDLGELLGQYALGETVAIRVLSDGSEKEYRIILN